MPLRSLLAAVAGYVDHIMDTVGRRLIGSYGPLTEALRRRRLEENGGTRVVGQLFGVALDEASYERGQAFVRGIVERAGTEGLDRLWRSERELPTPAELDAPGPVAGPHRSARQLTPAFDPGAPARPGRVATAAAPRTCSRGPGWS